MCTFFVLHEDGGSGFTPTCCLYIQTICLPQLKQGLLILAFTSLLSYQIFASPYSVLREKVHNPSSFNAVCLAPNSDPFADCGRCSATDSLSRALSRLSPSAWNFFRCRRSIHQFHISLLAGYSIFKVHGNLTFHIYPDIRKAKYSKKMKKFLNFFISQKRQKNKTFENALSKVLLLYIQLG